jgi:hypothetical protein
LPRPIRAKRSSDASTEPIAERDALAAIRADSEDPSAHHALGYIYSERCSFVARVSADLGAAGF